MSAFSAQRRWFSATSKSGRAVFATLAVFTLLAATEARAARPTSPSAGAVERPNLLVITVDTWRWDYLGATGLGKVKTPNLDALAAQGLLFTNTLVSAPVTLVSHASLFTGTHPTTHGVHHNGTFVLADDHATLAESFRAAGYRTGAVTGAYVVSSRFGLAQGFDTYLDVYARDLYESGGLTPFYPELTASEVTDRSLELVKSFSDRGQRQPWMLWAHYFDPHAAYRAPKRFADQYPKDRYAAEVAYVDAEIGRLLAGLGPQRARTAVLVTADHGESLGEHGEATHGHFVYDATVRVATLLQIPGGPAGRHLDQRVRSIDLMPTVLTAAGLPVPRAVQGRDLAPLWRGEGGRYPAYTETYLPYFDYGWAYQRALILDGWKYILSPKPELYHLDADPGEKKNLLAAEPERAESLRATLERMIASTSGAKAPNTQMDAAGRDALASLGYLGGGAPPPEETAEELASLPDPKDRIHLEGELARAWTAQSRGDLSACLKILDRVLAEDRKNAAALRLAAAVSRENGEPRRSLGYLETLGQHWPSEAWRHDYAAAHQAWKSGKAANARKLYDQLLLPCDALGAQAADLPPSSERCFNSLSDLVHMELEAGSDASARKALAQHPLSAVASASVGDRLRVAQLHAKTGPASAAEAALTALVRTYPRVPDVHLALGNFHREQGKAEAAQAAYQQALKVDGDFTPALNNLATLHGTRGELTSSTAYLRRVLAVEPNNTRAMGNLALNLYLGGQPREAMELLERTVKLDPGAINARLNLARIYLEAEQTSRALSLAREVQRLEPDNVLARRIVDRFESHAHRGSAASRTTRSHGGV